MTRRVVLNVLETFFRRPWVYLIPLVLLMVLGIYSGFSAERMYRSVGTLNSSSGTVLNDIANSTTNRGFGYESTADGTARNINQQLVSDAFLDQVVARAGLGTAMQQQLISYDDLRTSIWASAEGDNLVSVSATTAVPEQSLRLAKATIEEYLEYVVENDNADRLIAIETYQTQLDARSKALDAANQEYEDYMLAHQIADEDDRPFVEQIAIQRLERNVEQATDDYQDAESRLNDAQFQADVAQTVIERQLRLVDEPQMPQAPQPRLKKAVMTVALFTMLGLVLSLATLVAASLLDRTVRVSDDVDERFGMDVIAVVPSARKR